MASAFNERVAQALAQGYTEEDIRQRAITRHKECMAAGYTREEADKDMQNVWGLRASMSKSDAYSAEWVASLLFEPGEDSPIEGSSKEAKSEPKQTPEKSEKAPETQNGRINLGHMFGRDVSIDLKEKKVLSEEPEQEAKPTYGPVTGPGVGTKVPESLFENLVAGMQHSTGGMWARSSLPDFTGPSDGVLAQTLFSVGQAFGDAPVAITGGLIGAASGSAVAPGIGTAVGAGAGAMGTIGFVRSVLTEQYRNGNAMNWSDMFARWGNASMAFAHEAMLGATLNPAARGTMAATEAALGKLSDNIVVRNIQNTLMRMQGGKAMLQGAKDIATATAGFGAELGLMTADQSLSELRIPTMADFQRNCIGLLGVKYFGGMTDLGLHAYSKFNIHPKQLSLIFKLDPSFAQRLVQDATAATRGPWRAAYAIETRTAPQYSKWDPYANTKANPESSLYFSLDDAERQLAIYKGIDRDETNPLNVAYKKAVAVEEAAVEKARNAEKSWVHSEVQITKINKKLYSAAEDLLVERGVIPEKRGIYDNKTLREDMDAYERTSGAARRRLFGGDVNAMEKEGKFFSALREALKDARKTLSEKDQKRLAKHEENLKSRAETRRLLAEKVAEAKDAREKAWYNAPMNSTEQNPFRRIVQRDVPNKAPIIQIPTLGHRALFILGDRFLESPEGQSHPLAPEYQKMREQMAKKTYRRNTAKWTKDYANLIASRDSRFIDWLQSGPRFTIDEIRDLGGDKAVRLTEYAIKQEQKENANQPTVAELAEIFGVEVPVNKNQTHQIFWAGIQGTANGRETYWPIDPRRTRPGSIDYNIHTKPSPEKVSKAMQKIREAIQFKPAKRRLSTMWNDFMTAAYNRFYRLNKGAPAGRVTESFLRAEETSTAGRRGQIMLDHGILDWKTEKPIEGLDSLRSIIEGRGLDLDILSEFLVADTTTARIAKGESNLVHNQSAIDLMQALYHMKEFEPYKKAVQDIRKIQKALIQYNYDGDQLTTKNYKKLMKSRTVIPLERLVESFGDKAISDEALQMLQDTGILPKSKAQSWVEAVEEWRQSNKGQIIDPIQSLMAYHFITARATMVNRARKVIAEDWGIKDIREINEDTETAYASRSTTPLVKLTYRDKGEIKHDWVEREVLQAAQNMDRASSNIMVRFLSKGAGLLRGGTAAAPAFMIKNGIIDQMTAGVQSRTGLRPFVDMGEAITHLLLGNRSEKYREWIIAGGQSGSFARYGRDEWAKQVEEIQRRRVQNQVDLTTSNIERLQHLVNPFTYVRAVKNMIGDTYEALTFSSELIENIPRMAEYLRAREKGLTKAEAAYLSRTITMDFGRAGAQVKALNQMAAFLNAGIQGFSRVIETARQNPTQFAVNVTKYVMLPSIWLSLAEASIMISEPDSPGADIARNRPMWDRAAYWGVYLDDETYGRFGHMVRIPKPHGMLALFTQPFEAFIHEMAEYGEIDDPLEALKENGIGRAFTQSLPVDINGAIPTAMNVAAEVAANHSFFTDQSLVSSRYEKLLPEFQSKMESSGTAVMLGELFAEIEGGTGLPIPERLKSPLILDHVIKTLGGQLAGQVAQVIGDFLPTGLPEKPMRPWWQNPFVKNFSFKYPSYQAAAFEQFNERYERAEKIYNTFKMLASSPRASDQEIARKLAMDQQIVNLQSLKIAMSSFGTLIENTYKNDNLSREEKAEQIDNAMVQQIKLARQANDLLRDIERQNEWRKMVDEPVDSED